jgi:putative oxidoreductase
MATTNTQTELDGLRDWSPFVVRVALGIVFVVNGAGKLFEVGPEAIEGGVGGFEGFLGGLLGVPLPGVMAWVVTFVEFFGGLFILLGVLTRLSGALITVNMLVATYLVHLQNGFASGDGGFEYTMVLALLGISLVLSGPGRLSVAQSVLGKELLPNILLPGGGRPT